MAFRSQPILQCLTIPDSTEQTISNRDDKMSPRYEKTLFGAILEEDPTSRIETLQDLLPTVMTSESRSSRRLVISNIQMKKEMRTENSSNERKKKPLTSLPGIKNAV